MQLPEPFVEPTQRRIRVRLADSVIADTTRAPLYVAYGPGVLPTSYVPLGDVRPEALVERPVTPWSPGADRPNEPG